MSNMTLLIGTMGGGKSDFLTQKYEQLQSDHKMLAITAKQNHHGRFISSRSGREVPAIFIDEVDSIDDYEYIFIDEVMLFDDQEMLLLNQLLQKTDHQSVYLASLNVDWQGNEFPIVTRFKEIAQEVIEIYPTCELCGVKNANHHLKLSGKNQAIEVDKDLYKTVCQPCWHEKQTYAQIT